MHSSSCTWFPSRLSPGWVDGKLTMLSVPHTGSIRSIRKWSPFRREYRTWWSAVILWAFHRQFCMSIRHQWIMDQLLFVAPSECDHRTLRSEPLVVGVVCHERKSVLEGSIQLYPHLVLMDDSNMIGFVANLSNRCLFQTDGCIQAAVTVSNDPRSIPTCFMGWLERQAA